MVEKPKQKQQKIKILQQQKLFLKKGEKEVRVLCVILAQHERMNNDIKMTG